MKISLHIWVGLLWALASCSANTGGRAAVPVVVHASPTANSLIGNWSGLMPCATCPGIDYNLVLYPNSTYQETLVYQDREDQPTIKNGSWAMNNGVLELTARNQKQTRFEPTENGLVLLDGAEDGIPTGIDGNYRLQKTPLPQQEGQGFQANVDFIASGNEPSWSLEIDLNNMIRFRSQTAKGETVLHAPVPLPQELEEGARVLYMAKSAEGPLEVEILRQPCRDTMSGEQQRYTVRVRTNGEKLEGCGTYLYDDRLHGTWLLQRLLNQEIADSAYKRGTPALNFNLINRRLTGHAGCNRINGSISVKGDELLIGAIAGTKMACPALETENTLLRELSKASITYSIEGETLVLQRRGETVMVFKRMEQ